MLIVNEYVGSNLTQKNNEPDFYYVTSSFREIDAFKIFKGSKLKSAHIVDKILD